MNDFKRTRLQHSTPPWGQDGAVYFLTINVFQRHTNQLVKPAIAETIKHAVQLYKDIYKWHPRLVVLMPDHLHMLVSLNTKMFSIRQIVSPWKGYLRKTQKIEWQEGFLEHRIRDRVSLEEKEVYLQMNPVRASLVKNPEDWPYTWSASSFQKDTR